MGIDDCARSPSVALVDDVTVSIDEERPIAVRTRLHRAAPLICDRATPKQDLAIFVNRFELYPNVKCVNRPTWEKMADSSIAHHDLNENF